MEVETPDAASVQSVERGLAVLRAFSVEHPRLSLSDVAKATGLDRSVARRFLATLLNRGYLRSDGHAFSLHPRVMQVGNGYLAGLALPKIAAPLLAELVETVQESSSMSVLDGGEIVYVARVPTTRLITMSTSVGTRLPAYATSMGRVLLASRWGEWLDGYIASVELQSLTSRTITDERRFRAELDRVRRQGWAIVDQELADGLCSIAVPVRLGPDRIVAAINVSSDVSRNSADKLRVDVLPRLLATANRIGRSLANGTSSPAQVDIDD